MPAGFQDDDPARRSSKPKRQTIVSEEKAADVEISSTPMSANERRMLMIRDRKSGKDSSPSSASEDRLSASPSPSSSGARKTAKPPPAPAYVGKSSSRMLDRASSLPEGAVVNIKRSQGSDEDEKKDSDDENVNKKSRDSQASVSVAEDDEPDVEITNEGIKFNFAKHRSGAINRALKLGKAQDEQTMLSFKKTLIKKSLLKSNRKYDDQCVQSFKNIMSYMGDRRSIKKEVAHAKKLIWNGLKAVQSVRDEIYLQICKQVTNHPKVSHAVKGWELMMLVLACFPPSPLMRKHLEAQFEKTLKEETVDDAVKNFAKICLDRLPKIMNLGPRLEAPSVQEILRDENGNLFCLKLYTLDGQMRTMEVDCFVPVKDVTTFMVQVNGIGYGRIFSMFEVNRHGEERALDDNIRILDVIGRWDRLIKEHNIKHPEPFRLVFKAELVLKTTDQNVADDDEAIRLLYVQAVADMLNERYPLNRKLIPSMAALHLQASYGHFEHSTHTLEWLEERIKELVSDAELNRYGKKKSEAKKELAQKIFAKYSRLEGISAQEARLAFMDYAQESPLYGAMLSLCEQSTTKELPPSLLLAITCDAVCIVHPVTRDVIETFNWSEIITFGSADNKIVLQVGDVISQRKIVFKTGKGKQISRLLQAYVMERMDSKAAKKY
eukprot:TRINITY_DN6139_c0_g1_i1.p1 TRINITY_DN6139_c0_g1~~TRINITY_DN6139_c0_g1_i1.p1  ORF type:complete len:702 (+),score=211.53 TRINITY_DN6139_c0_g1_i1:117-2108(+)